MKEFNWDRTWETGHPLIDSQHKQLMEAINALLQAIYQNAGKDEVKNTLDFLNDYTIKHFFDEERLQKKYNYPDIENHKQYHQAFKKTVRDMIVELINRGITDELAEKVQSSIGDWLVNHIKIQDFKLVAHIKSQDPEALVK
ncbi:MAG: hemerythrin family protein [Spirochaetaceae bacterium]|jgi:hemerythrin|nr:hemerythrin family protein [Spirochaetaceae bacterium]